MAFYFYGCIINIVCITLQGSLSMILFFVRSLTDIDHMVPIVYKFTKDGYKKLMILCISPIYNIKSDVHLNFLKNKYNVDVDYIFGYYKPTITHRIFSSLVCFFAGMKMWDRLVKKISLFIYNKLNKHSYFDMEWAKGVLIKACATTLVFDHAKPWNWFIGSLLDASKNIGGISTIAVPHGIRQWPNSESHTELLIEGSNVNYIDALPFNFILVPNEEHKKHMLIRGIPEERLVVMGSARYCCEWMSVLPEIIKNNGKLPDTNKLKIVFMEGGQLSLIDKQIYLDTLNQLAELNNIELIVKCKLRHSSMNLNMLKKNIIIGNDIASPLLINWADAIIVGNTSILYEILNQYKTMIYPTYFYSLKPIFETMNSAWIVNSYEELKNAIIKLTNKSQYRPYKQENVDKFLKEIIYNGNSNRDILKDYKEFILEIDRN